MQLNVAELDPHINPGDHSDHLVTAKAAIAAAGDLSCIRLVSYVDYASSKLPENLDLQQRDMESSVFAVTLAGVQALDQPHLTGSTMTIPTSVGTTFACRRSPRAAHVAATEIAARRRTQ